MVSEHEATEPTAVHRQTLWEIVDRSEQCLSQEEKEQLFALLLEYHNLFATGAQDFGQTGRVKHTINTGTAQPIRQQMRRIPQFRRQEAKKLLDDMLDKGVIQPSDSPWASPVVVDDTLDTLAGSKWFSTLDLLSGYWQVEVDPNDREKTAFCTSEGLFEFCVMPLGYAMPPPLSSN